MSDASQKPDRVAELLVPMGRAARSEEARSALAASHRACLRRFARAYGDSRSPSGLARVGRKPRGTASQIVRSLEQRVPIAGFRAERDRRRTRFNLTQSGRGMLHRHPLRSRVGGSAGIGGSGRDRFSETLSRLAKPGELPAFATSRDCSHVAARSAGGPDACMAAEQAAAEIDRSSARFAALRAEPVQGRQ